MRVWRNYMLNMPSVDGKIIIHMLVKYIQKIKKLCYFAKFFYFSSTSFLIPQNTKAPTPKYKTIFITVATVPISAPKTIAIILSAIRPSKISPAIFKIFDTLFPSPSSL